MTASTLPRNLICVFAATAFFALCVAPAAAQRAGGYGATGGYGGSATGGGAANANGFGANGVSASSTGGAASSANGASASSTGGAASAANGASASSTGGAATAANGGNASSTGGAASSANGASASSTGGAAATANSGNSASAATAGVNGNSTARSPAPAPGPGDHSKIWFGDDVSASCGAGPMLPDPNLWSDAGDGVKAISRATKSYIMGCHCDTQACIADALDKYAAALAAVAPRLPRELQNLPSLVSTAARRVRAARTKSVAMAILKETIAHVHKEIELVRADDPDSLRRLTRGGTFVEGALETASIKLERADSL